MTQLPPLILTLALALWSWQTGAWVIGVLLAAVIEWAMHTTSRWQLSEKSLERLVDLTSLLLLALVIYYGSAHLASGIFSILRWSPLLLAPLLAVQILSARPGISYRALFLSQRRSRSPEADQTLDLRPVYLGACLLAAGTALPDQALSGYFLGALALSAWMIIWQPSRQRRPWLLWLVLLALAATLAYAGQFGLRDAQRRIEDAAVSWMSDVLMGKDDPYRAQTALGDIGELKLSDRVLYRVSTQTPLTSALLLRTASYDRYAGNSWFTRERDFAPVPYLEEGWQWGAQDRSAQPVAALRIGGYLPRQGSLLPVPLDSWRISELPVGSLTRHPLGALKAKDGPRLVRYALFQHAATTTDRPPEDSDLRVPKIEQAVLQQLVDELDLSAETPERTLERLSHYFATQFRYTLELPGTTQGQTALAHFLLERQRGHCEYFATATVLLLRQAGLPARYAVGYSVQEPDSGLNSYRVRRSHAHAWALVWHHGRWWNLDTTPALWAEHEAERRAFWQPVFDGISYLWYRFNLSRIAPGEQDNRWLWTLLAVLFAILAYRLRLGQRFRARRMGRKRTRVAPVDSALEGIARRLTRAGWPRRSGETDRQWLQRLQQEPTLREALQDLEELLHLHECERYRPRQLSATERHQLQTAVTRWQRRWERAI